MMYGARYVGHVRSHVFWAFRCHASFTGLSGFLFRQTATGPLELRTGANWRRTGAGARWFGTFWTRAHVAPARSALLIRSRRMLVALAGRHRP